jgi:hypothetical protein
MFLVCFRQCCFVWLDVAWHAHHRASIDRSRSYRASDAISIYDTCPFLTDWVLKKDEFGGRKQDTKMMSRRPDMRMDWHHLGISPSAHMAQMKCHVDAMERQHKAARTLEFGTISLP